MKKILIAALFLGLAFNSNSVFAQTDISGRVPVYRATHTKTTELKHTKLKVNFDYQKEQMNGEEWLTASPYFYTTDSLVLNAKGMLIHEVSMDKKPLKYDYNNDILKINLGKTYQKNHPGGHAQQEEPRDFSPPGTGAHRAPNSPQRPWDPCGAGGDLRACVHCLRWWR